MNYTITDQREILEQIGMSDDAKRFGFELKYWMPDLENCPTYVRFSTREECEVYYLLSVLGGK